MVYTRLVRYSGVYHVGEFVGGHVTEWDQHAALALEKLVAIGNPV